MEKDAVVLSIKGRDFVQLCKEIGIWEALLHRDDHERLLGRGCEEA